jgi:zinc protease
LIAPTNPIPRVTIQEPARKTEQRFSESSPGVPLPAIGMSYLTDTIRSVDNAPLTLLNEVLTGGESSRLYQKLVYETQLASGVQSYPDLRTDAGLFQIMVTAAGGKALEALEATLQTELDRLIAEPVSAEELEKAKNRLLTQKLRGRETVSGLANALGEAAVLYGNVAEVNLDMARLLETTPEQIQAVATRVLTKENRVLVNYTKGADTLKVTDAPVKTTAPLPTKTSITRPIMPTPGNAPTVRTGAFFENVLSSGLKVIYLPQTGSGLITAQLLTRNGAASDPANRAGLADFVASLLTRGAGGKTAPELASAMEALGTELSSSAGWDSCQASFTSLSSRFAEALGLLRDVVVVPTLATDEIKRLQAERVDELAVEFEEPRTIARAVASKVLFGAGAYGHPRRGTPASVGSFTQADIVKLHKQVFRPDNSILVISGDFDRRELLTTVKNIWGKWERPTAPLLPVPNTKIPPTTRRVVLIDMPQAGQTAVALTRPGMTRRDLEFRIAEVVDSIYGGGYSSRLNQEVRIKRGLSYGAGSNLDGRRGVGPLVATCQTRHTGAVEVAKLFVSVLRSLGEQPVTPTELLARKSALSGDFARSLETTSGVAGQMALLALYDLPLSDLSLYLERVRKTTAEEVLSVTKRRLDARYASLIVVGDTKVYEKEMKALFGKIEVIPLKSLVLDSPTLKK